MKRGPYLRGGVLIEDLRNVVKSLLKSFLFEKKKKKKRTYKFEERKNKLLLALLRKNFPTDLYGAIF